MGFDSRVFGLGVEEGVGAVSDKAPPAAYGLTFFVADAGREGVGAGVCTKNEVDWGRRRGRAAGAGVTVGSAISGSSERAPPAA